jgi:hypothetical protein
MPIIPKLERKQVIVIIGSVLLAISSYFIPLPDQTVHRPSQTKQPQQSSLPMLTVEQQPVAGSVSSQVLLPDRQTSSNPQRNGGTL